MVYSSSLDGKGGRGVLSHNKMSTNLTMSIDVTTFINVQIVRVHLLLPSLPSRDWMLSVVVSKRRSCFQGICWKRPFCAHPQHCHRRVQLIYDLRSARGCQGKNVANQGVATPGLRKFDYSIDRNRKRESASINRTDAYLANVVAMYWWL